MKEVTLGIDIGGTNTKLGFVDRFGQVLAADSIATQAEQPVDQFLVRLYAAIEALRKKTTEVLDIKAVGIGAPNANYYSGMVEKAPNLRWGDKVPLAQLIEHHLHIPVRITNDANAAALGEMKYGVAQGMKNFVVITLGTGLGSGIVVNGDLLYGDDGFAGELGHVTVDPNGRDHTTGLKGSLETYASATGIKRTVFELLAKRIHPSGLRDISYHEMTALMISQAAEKGDLIALEAFEITARLLGMKLAEAVAVLSPEAIILFGGLAGSGDLLVKPTKKYMEEYMFPVFRGKVKLMLSDLKGNNTAVLGASALAWVELDKLKTTTAPSV